MRGTAAFLRDCVFTLGTELIQRTAIATDRRHPLLIPRGIKWLDCPTSRGKRHTCGHHTLCLCVAFGLRRILAQGNSLAYGWIRVIQRWHRRFMRESSRSNEQYAPGVIFEKLAHGLTQGAASSESGNSWRGHCIQKNRYHMRRVEAAPNKL